jgi:hypothetical protein
MLARISQPVMHPSLSAFMLIATGRVRKPSRVEKPRPVKAQDPWGKKRQFDSMGQQMQFAKVRQGVSLRWTKPLLLSSEDYAQAQLQTVWLYYVIDFVLPREAL